jgi:hypothetical protein
MANVVQLEAFESPLHRSRIRWFLLPDHQISYPPGFQEQCFTESPPFQRRILLTSLSSSEAWKLVDKWEFILMPTTPTDWGVVLTVLLNQPPPSLIISTPELIIPPAVFQKCVGTKAPTFICFQRLSVPPPQAQVTFDATFFPPSRGSDDALIEAINTILPQLISSEQMRNFNVKDALKDLKGAGATIVVSSIQEKQACLYWYYATESKARGKDLLATIVQTLLIRE